MRAILGCFLAMTLAPMAAAQPHLFESDEASFELVEVAGGLEFPWSMAQLPDGNLLVTERGGHLSHVDMASGDTRRLSGLPGDIFAERQGGMLGLALHPDFQANRFVYFAYSEGNARANRTVLARGRLNAEATALENVEDLFRVNFDKRRGFHFGGRIAFLRDASILLTVGEGASYRNEAQNLDNHLGTVIRVDDDGSVPFDNPFATSPVAQPEIYTYGHRNAQGITISPVTGSILISEHGPRGGDEINILQPGENYGWPLVSHGVNYNGSPVSERSSEPGLAEPVWHWTPSIAPAGIDFYTGEAFPAWQNDLFVTALAGQALLRLEFDGDVVMDEERLLEGFGERIRDVMSGTDGYLYIATDSENGRILRLVPVIH